MYCSLVHFPNIDKSRLNGFRERYDPYVGSIDIHITLVFPVPDIVGKDNLINHIENVLRGWKSFDIRIKGIEKAWDHWMFLLLKKGNEEIIKLHDELYTGILRPFLREDIEFIPHIAVGLFARKNAGYDLRDPRETDFDKENYDAALQEMKKLNLDYSSKVEKFSLVEVDDEFTKSNLVKEFSLS